MDIPLGVDTVTFDEGSSILIGFDIAAFQTLGLHDILTLSSALDDLNHSLIKYLQLIHSLDSIIRVHYTEVEYVTEQRQC